LEVTLVDGSNNSRFLELDFKEPHDGVYLIGELANAVGLEPKTIRFYELEGLLTSYRHGRFKFYGQKDVDHLLAIKKLRSFGFSIEKLRTLMAFENSTISLLHYTNPKSGELIRTQFTLTKKLVLEAQDMIGEFEECLSKLQTHA
jgi:MerR family transcriptional regulator, copper efflux regulator